MPKLPKYPGAVMFVVLRFLAERPGQEFRPTTIASHLGWSTSEVGRALIRLKRHRHVKSRSVKMDGLAHGKTSLYSATATGRRRFADFHGSYQEAAA